MCKKQKTVMMRLVIILLLSISIVYADKGHEHNEAHYIDAWCNTHCGDKEFKLNNGMEIDLLTNVYTIEFDFANNNGLYEAIGQSLVYAYVYSDEQTSRRAGVVFILETGGEDEIRLFSNLTEAIKYHNLPIDVWAYGDGIESDNYRDKFEERTFWPGYGFFGNNKKLCKSSRTAQLQQQNGSR